MAQWKEFFLVNRRLWVHLLPMPLRSNPGQVVCLSLFHASDSGDNKMQNAEFCPRIKCRIEKCGMIVINRKNTKKSGVFVAQNVNLSESDEK